MTDPIVSFNKELAYAITDWARIDNLAKLLVAFFGSQNDDEHEAILRCGVQLVKARQIMQAVQRYDVPLRKDIRKWSGSAL
jgi:hypothetical protein